MNEIAARPLSCVRFPQASRPLVLQGGKVDAAAVQEPSLAFSRAGRPALDFSLFALVPE